MVMKMDPKIQLKLDNRVAYAIATVATKNAGRNAVKYIRQELQRADRVDTGALSDSFEANLVHSPLGPQFEIVSNLPPLEPSGRTLADIVNNGTGIYGPYGSPIVSPYGNVMRFNPSRKTSSTGKRGVRNSARTGRFESAYVYAYTVQGQQGTGFLDKALARVSVADFIT